MAPHQTVVMDNGGCTIKVGLAGDLSSLRMIPNCTAKVKGERQGYIADTVLAFQDVLSLVVRRPIDRGYVVSWDLQRDIWTRVLKHVVGVNASTIRLVLTEPLFNLPALHDTLLQVLFEEIGVQEVFIGPPPVFSLRWHAHCHPGSLANTAGCGLVVDAGFSFTHAVPVFDWRVLQPAVRRIDLGGKALTNHMKALVSYRSINMMEETYLMELIKEQLCFVSQDPQTDLAASRGKASRHRRVYVLPDGVSDKLGHMLDEAGGETMPIQKDTALVVNSERFMVPEAIFHPSGIGLEQAGLAETIAAAVQAAHPTLHGLLYSNVLLTGGTTTCPGFKERLESELRPLVPDDYQLGVFLADDPLTCAWKGAALAAADPASSARFITRAQYQRSTRTTTPTPEPRLEDLWADDE
ncbi:hypothetical protein ACKKBF_B15355 [Auxenochlorella protothecoides x Auxenochlorella symbiontica]